jgi:hypothetical protein
MDRIAEQTLDTWRPNANKFPNQETAQVRGKVQGDAEPHEFDEGPWVCAER